jgi:hypothetical protein
MGLVSWKTQTVMEFDERSFKLAHPELHHAFVRESRRRTFRLL